MIKKKECPDGTCEVPKPVVPTCPQCKKVLLKCKCSENDIDK